MNTGENRTQSTLWISRRKPDVCWHPLKLSSTATVSQNQKPFTQEHGGRTAHTLVSADQSDKHWTLQMIYCGGHFMASCLEIRASDGRPATSDTEILFFVDVVLRLFCEEVSAQRFISLFLKISIEFCLLLRFLCMFIVWITCSCVVYFIGFVPSYLWQQ